MHIYFIADCLSNILTNYGITLLLSEETPNVVESAIEVSTIAMSIAPLHNTSYILLANLYWLQMKSISNNYTHNAQKHMATSYEVMAMKYARLGLSQTSVLDLANLYEAYLSYGEVNNSLQHIKAALILSQYIPVRSFYAVLHPYLYRLSEDSSQTI